MRGITKMAAGVCSRQLLLLLLLGVLAMSPARSAPTSAGGLTTRYDEDSGRIQLLTKRAGREVEVGYITAHGGGSDRPRSLVHERRGDEERFDFGDSRVVIRPRDTAARCFAFQQWVNASTTVLRSCQHHLASHIYGGIEATNQVWPIEGNVYDHYPYVTDQDDHAGIASRYWLFSDGRFVFVHSNVPLFIDQHTDQSLNRLCFIAENTAPYPESRQDNIMEWNMCLFDSPRDAHLYAVQNYLGKPTAVPDTRMATEPVWSTGNRYNTAINEQKVRSFANEIVASGFNFSQIEIDDFWETCYGSLTFDTSKFPDVRTLTDDLHALGFRVTLWVHPFVVQGCEPYYSDALAAGYFVTNTEGSTDTRWYKGVAGVVDFTNPEAAAWWTDRLWALRNETGIDSFEFDAGQTSWLPQLPVIEPVERNPVRFTDEYAATASQFGPLVEIQAAVESQRLPNFFLMDIVSSSWGASGGLRTLLPKLLEISMVGHPFVMPEMVGGATHVLPSQELYTRWLQATVFMPAIKFSFTPWDFDDETLEICRSLMQLRAQYAPVIEQLLQKAAADGTPLNLPVWWVDPSDSVAHTIDSEFLLGEGLLVAPVLDEGAVARDVYLPAGAWRDEADPEHPTVRGPRWLYDYSAPLATLPYFTRIADS
ncbi:myogenesis-regulating glycosidase-like [Schistocerca gregaria]|uniref:myogenesis-regulating glycosidase-like n=1 Tax=Schistocerca gregaria TaxID=7010 RepID=UPI00211DA701|nr:myogenesis-regulating glycosidase-like [Schistocerca gregaria]